MPNSKGSKNNFIQRDIDPSMKIDKHGEAKVRLKELASEITRRGFESEKKFQLDANHKMNEKSIKISKYTPEKKSFTELLKKPVRGLGVKKTKSETAIPAPISDIQKIIGEPKKITKRYKKSKMCDIKSALMNSVHTIPDEGIDDDAISKLMVVINIAKDKATMTTRIRDINKPKDENNQKKVSFAYTIKRNIKIGDTKKIPQKTAPRNPIVFTEDQMLKVINGQSPFESTKYKLVYFEGIKRCRVTWGIFINKKAAPQLVKHMDTIKGITYDSIYNPIAAKEGEQSGLDQLKARLKWQLSDTNRNKSAQTMAILITKMTEINTDEFSDMFLYTHQPETAEIQMDATGTESTSGTSFHGTPWFQKTTSITTSNSRMDFAGNS
ncbi:hypothetical protein BB559_006143, partial [Furculomyces boomerangus]